MKTRDRLTLGLVSALGPALVRALHAGARFSIRGDERLDRVWAGAGPAIFVLWHGRLVPLLYLYRDRGIVILVSQHRDGEYVARLAEGLGYTTVRGSSTRGGERGFRELVRALRAGRSVAITPDGPRGPRERLKPGAVHLAQATGAPIIPILAGTRRALWFEGWDRFMIPLPLAHIRVAVGRPRRVTAGLPDAEQRRVADELEAELAQLKEWVDRGRAKAGDTAGRPA